MKNNVFKVVLLQALPASGKSEVRNFMAHVEPGRLQEEFHIGENLQLDDFPYVHMMSAHRQRAAGHGAGAGILPR